jgi:hypothetical protein
MKKMPVGNRRSNGLANMHRYAHHLWLLAALLVAGCSTTVTSPLAPAAPSSQQEYFGPATSNNLNRATFAIDHTAGTFVQYDYLASAGNEQYIANSGNFAVLANGILNIGVTYGSGNGTQGTLYTPPQTGNWTVEWPGQGGLVGTLGQSFVPIAPNQSCPSLSTALNFQFVTLPVAGDKTGTAYGSVSVGTSGQTVTFNNIAQFNISGGVSANPSAASVSGTCSPTFFGQTISVPNVSIVTNPGNGQNQTPSATIVVGPTGFLVEDNGYTPNPLAYENTLGAGTGAVGLPTASSPLTTNSLIGAQYTGFIYGTGAAGNNIKNLVAVPASSRISSFGYPNVQTACPTPPAPSTSTILYGGEFTGNNPAAHPFGNCDFAIDFGAQDAKNNGLYPSVTVWIGAAFPGNTTGKNYSFPAVAIAAQLQGKYAIMLIALDTVGLQTVSQGQQSQDWGVYLLQSN